jgi:hypothetical protein
MGATPPGGWGTPEQTGGWGVPPEGGWVAQDQRQWDVPGWGRPPLTPEERRTRRKRGALWLGVGSFLLTIGAVVVFVIGLATFLFGGFLLWFVAAAMAVVAVVLALWSFVAAARVRGGPVSTRVLAAVPGALTLLLLGSLAYGGTRSGSPGHEPDRRPVDASATPEEVVERAGILLRAGDARRLCLLVAERARTPGCADAGDVRRRSGAYVADVKLVRADERRAVVSYEIVPAGIPGDRVEHRVRLEREAAGWALLDLPTHPNSCVDTARDPFRCRVTRWGAP